MDICPGYTSDLNIFENVVKTMRKKIIPCFIVIVILASIFSGCIEEKMPESTDQKSAEGEWKPHIPSYTQPDIPDHGDAFDHAMNISEGVSQMGETHNARMNQLVTDITANNERIEQWSKEHDARIDELDNKMIEKSARIDQWSKEHNDRINELNSKIIEQNANIDELVKDIAAQNAKTCEEVKKLQDNLNNAAAQNTELCKKMEEHNARMDGHIKKIEDHNARIDQWSKDYNTRLNELEGDIEARNAAICEASIQAQEHIDVLSKEINDCLEDVIHMWEDIAINLITPDIPGAEKFVRHLLKIEQRQYNNKELSYSAGVFKWVKRVMYIPYIVINIENANELSRLKHQQISGLMEQIIRFSIKINENTHEISAIVLRYLERIYFVLDYS